jgi:hypothetical protein
MHPVVRVRGGVARSSSVYRPTGSLALKGKRRRPRKYTSKAIVGLGRVKTAREVI